MFTEYREITKLNLHIQPGNKDGHRCFTTLSLLQYQFGHVSSLRPSSFYQHCEPPYPSSFKQVPKPACCSFQHMPASLLLVSLFHSTQSIEAQSPQFSSSKTAILVSLREGKLESLAEEKRIKAPYLSF